MKNFVLMENIHIDDVLTKLSCR